MKKGGILNGELMKVLTELRHYDAIAVLDVGMPIPHGCKVIDLALVRGIPSLLDTVKAILGEIVVERFDVFDAMIDRNKETYDALCALMPRQQQGTLTFEQFPEALKNAKACVRTAEFGACCNMVLYSASGLDVNFEKYNIEL